MSSKLLIAPVTTHVGAGHTAQTSRCTLDHTMCDDPYHHGLARSLPNYCAHAAFRVGRWSPQPERLMIGHYFDLPDTLGGSEPQRASVLGVGVPLLQHQHFGQRRLDIGHCPPANRRPNHDPRPAADWIHYVGHLVAIASKQHGHLGIVLVIGGDPDTQSQGTSSSPCRKDGELIQRKRRVEFTHTRHGCIFAVPSSFVQISSVKSCAPTFAGDWRGDKRLGLL